ncbi:MAG TPA: hypothetical protein VJ824_02920 [Bacillota bacterium]|nr:hypothetical protein [Bacillota bacterium]
MEMTVENIQETYNVQELRKQRDKLKNQLETAKLTDDEKWEIDFLLKLINKRIRLMTDLLVGIPLEFK